MYMKRFVLIILFIFFMINLPSIAQEEILIIFDASVSMLDIFDGSPKYISAIKQAKSVLNKLPQNSKIGLRTIGVSIDSALLSLLQNPNELCKSTTLQVPISQNSVSKINSSLDEIFPLGTTPLEYTLSLAVNRDFSEGNYIQKHIILITDGADSCNGNPCRYIRELMSTRNDIKIDIIAIGVNADDFKQLNCISSSTSGTLFNVKNNKEMNMAFNKSLKPTFNTTSNFIETGIKYKNYTFQFYD